MTRHSLKPWAWRIGYPRPFGLPPEDPIRIQEFSENINSLSWGSTESRESLKKLFDEIGRLVQAEIRYYYSRRKASSKRATGFRFFSWLFGSIGVLAPIVSPLVGESSAEFLSWGYLAVAGAGVFIVADKVFSGSEAHARFVTTQLRVEHAYSKFALEWQALLLAHDREPSAERVAALIEKAMAYIDAFHESLGAETTEWRTTLKSVKEELARQASDINTPK